MYNKYSGNCEKPNATVVTKPGVTQSFCPADKPIWNNVSKICQLCPVDKPYYSKKNLSCIPCPKSTYWNATAKICIINCTAGTVLIIATQQCESI